MEYKVIHDSCLVKPVVKWAGGKTALLNDINRLYPQELGLRINKYCEPFVGGGGLYYLMC